MRSDKKKMPLYRHCLPLAHRFASKNFRFNVVLFQFQKSTTWWEKSCTFSKKVVLFWFLCCTFLKIWCTFLRQLLYFFQIKLLYFFRATLKKTIAILLHFIDMWKSSGCDVACVNKKLYRFYTETIQNLYRIYTKI